VPGNRCDTVRPELEEDAPGHFARCHLTPTQKDELAAARLATTTAAKEGA
jgi:hypothetical protein